MEIWLLTADARHQPIMPRRSHGLLRAVAATAALAPAAVAMAQCDYTVAYTLPDATLTCGGQAYRPGILALADDGSACGLSGAGAFCPQRPFVWHPGDASITILPMPPGMVEGWAQDLNQSNVVVGFVKNAADTQFPCRWVNGVASLLPMPRGFVTGAATGVNSSGVIAGFVGNGFHHHAVTWTNGIVQDLHSMVPPPNVSSLASDISDSNVVVGVVAYSTSLAAIWSGTDVTILPAVIGGTSSQAGAMNSKGQVVGTGTLSPGVGRSFSWANGVMLDFGVLTGLQTCTVMGVNDAGRAAGWCYTGITIRSFVWQDGALSMVRVAGVPLMRELMAIDSFGRVADSGRTVYQPVPRPPFDIDQNCVVNVSDLLEVINCWGQNGGPADCTLDGTVNSNDMLLVIVNWT